MTETNATRSSVTELGTSLPTAISGQGPNSKIPTLEVKLTGPSTYPEWMVSIQNYLDLIPAGEYRVWDVVTGLYVEILDNGVMLMPLLY